MKIAIFAGTLKENQDGVTRVVYKQVEFLKNRGVEFLGITPQTEENSLIATQEKIPYLPFPLYTAYRLSLPRMERIKRIVEQFKPDLIYLNSPCTLGYAGIKIGKELGIPIVATYHTHFPTYLRYYRLSIFNGVVWSYLRYFYNQCDIVFVPSKSVLNELKENGINNLVYLPHGVDTSLFNPNKADENFRNQICPRDKNLLLSVGRIVKEKNFDVLEDAMRILSERRRNFRLVVAGEGPYLRYYQKRIPNSLFLGRLDSESLAKLYATSDIFVFPSVTESFGNVIIEAMASGLSPVVAKSFGASELIDNGDDGLLAEPNDAKSLADNIEFLLENEYERKQIGLEAFAKAQKFSWENTLDIFHQILIQNNVAVNQGAPVEVPSFNFE